MADRVSLYQRVPPLGDNIPVTVAPFTIKNAVPDEEEINWAVKRLQFYCSAPPLGDEIGATTEVADGGPESGGGGSGGDGDGYGGGYGDGNRDNGDMATGPV